MTADRNLFFCVSALIFLGVLMSYSLSSYTSVVLYHYGEFHFFVRQLFSAFLGIGIMWGLSKLDPKKWFSRLGFLLFFLPLLLTIGMVFLPESLSSSAGGAKRWIRLGFFSLAPLEFLKIGFTFFLAWSLSRTFVLQDRASVKEEVITFVPYSLVFLLLAFVVGVMQNDLGQIVLLGAVLAVLLVFSGGSAHLFGLIVSGAFAISVIAIVTSAHRILRLKLWWSNLQNSFFAFLPDKLANALRMNDLPESYQIFHAGNAMYNGGFLGQGLGLGQIKLGFLSEVHTDMVLAGIAEELGFVGLLFCVMVFVVLMVFIFKIANRLKEPKHALFCVGVALLLGFSLVINAFGVGGIFPVKGLAVPFLSYGGSSLLANCIAIGLVLSLARYAKDEIS
ncbi:FtsW/RodA/SpoVE family cell cycle protein [Helicobacter cetorum]|uniref:Probable peptidoglycan glycosyltransferase FtsW n=1 Tax=Helicobacter cetorum (strain ATCC BAA-429 / MIT 00-7128) TaxID=182217 RepID=I0EKB5_HELC0|nr:FtsW/RodA/SpoVE family cell cycle protein [Helicobacter cetorum]AFI03384.1 cell division protein FtsW [Helicobacter cetorum MIT 00-7128]